jgi:hypothetical protein
MAALKVKYPARYESEAAASATLAPIALIRCRWHCYRGRIESVRDHIPSQPATACSGTSSILAAIVAPSSPVHERRRAKVAMSGTAVVETAKVATRRSASIARWAWASKARRRRCTRAKAPKRWRPRDSR